MEKLVSIIEQHPLQEHSYTDRNGQPQIFASRGFTLTDGIDTFYAEAVGDTARHMPHYDPQLSHAAQMQMSVREYKDKDGNAHYANEVRITRMV